MLNCNNIPDSVLTALLARKGLDESDESYAKISQLSAREAFAEFLAWHGFFGYDTMIVEALDGLRAAVVSSNKGYSVTIKAQVESPETIESLTTFYKDIMTDYEGTQHKTIALHVEVK
jgi:hypothetical protein